MTKISRTTKILSEVQLLAHSQALTISENQCIRLGFSQKRIHNMLKNRLWRRLLPGVYYVASSVPSTASRLHAALLYAGDDAAISHESAAYFHGIVASQPTTVSVVIPHDRRVKKQRQLEIIRRRSMPDVQSDFPVVSRAEAVLDVAEREQKAEAVLGIITEAIRKKTRPHDILQALKRRKRHRYRKLIRSLLFDATLGIESPLEYLFHHDVEAAHGLPRSQKQIAQRINGRWTRSDCRYLQYLLRIELDGELAHPGGRTHRDTWRDNEVSLQESDLTLRYRWFHVVAHPCQTAGQIARALQQRGWKGSAKRCGPNCKI